MKYAVGEIYGRITIIGPAGKGGQCKRLVRCVCGYEKEVWVTHLSNQGRVYGCNCPKVSKAESSKRYTKNNPEKVRLARQKYKEANREKVNAWTREYARFRRELSKTDPALSRLFRGYRRRDYVKRQYGITQDDYQRMFDRQGGLCAICELPDKSGTLRIDHDHIVGHVRGLLCHNCNTMLGHAKDSAMVLSRAIEYLGCPL